MATFQTTHIVYFSPTHTSEKIARAIGEGIGMERRIETDLTLDEGTSPIEIKDSLTILAAPVYGGRVAPIALQRMKRLKGTNAPVILVAVYGNRDYEDPRELSSASIAIARLFCPWRWAGPMRLTSALPESSEKKVYRSWSEQISLFRRFMSRGISRTNR